MVVVVNKINAAFIAALGMSYEKILFLNNFKIQVE